jgi:autotransporter-associated beta strand protein
MFHLLTGLFERPMKWNGGTMFNNNQAGTSTVDAAMELAVDTPANIGGTGTNAQMILTNTLTGSGGFSKSGTGRLRITGSAQYTGVTNVSDGEIQYQNNFTTGSGINVTGGKLTMMTNGNNVLRSGPISVSATGAVDVNDNDIVVEGQAFTDVLNLVLSGFQVPTGGITSSTSDGSQIHALFDNALVGAGDWLGVPIGANAIVGKYTYFGDANIDGQVTGDDYGVVDANLNTTPPVGLGWLSGDMNLDGSVTGDDYGVIDANLGLGVGNPLSPSSLNVVPEPTSLGLIAAGAGLLLGRRRRRNA